MKKIKGNIKKIITSLSKKSTFLRKIFRKLLFWKRRLKYMKHYKKNIVDEKLIIFESYRGRSYACSPKVIYEEMLKDERFKDYTFVWAFKDPKKYEYMFTQKCPHCGIGNDSLKNAIIIKYGSQKYFEYYSKAKYWITNSRLPEHIVKKPDQVYVQCWHGTPLKRLGGDIIAETKSALASKKEIMKEYSLEGDKISYMLSPSKFSSEKFSTAFDLKNLGKENVIIEEGYPRNDFLFNYKKDDIKRIKEELNIPANKKIILYAPTYRDDQHKSGLGYTYKTEVDFDYLKEKLEDDYVILFRAHYFIANSFDFEKYGDFIYDVSKIDDINELYIISDILITDYSSVFFDYANLKRPIIFYMYDLDHYEKELRGFYVDLEELPGDIVKKEKDIVDILNNIKGYKAKYKEKYKKFNQKFNYLDDGKAAKRVINQIFFK